MTAESIYRDSQINMQMSSYVHVARKKKLPEILWFGFSFVRIDFEAIFVIESSEREKFNDIHTMIFNLNALFVGLMIDSLFLSILSSFYQTDKICI